MTFLEWVGLVFLLLTTAISDGTLLYDGVLWSSDRQTISERQWAQLKQWRAWKRWQAWLRTGYGSQPTPTERTAFPWLVVLLPLGMLFGPLGLLVHFLT